MSHYQGNDKIYEELRGYFPPEYDLTPDELEKEIETENKKREIALGMMRAHLSEDKSDPANVFVPKSKILATEPTHKARPEAAAPEKKPPLKITKEEPIEDPEDVTENLTDTFTTEIMTDEAEPSIPSKEAPELLETEDDMANESAPTVQEDTFDYGPLDDLFDLMEEEKTDDEAEGSDPASAEALSEGRKNVSWFFDLLEVFAVCITCIIVIFAIFFRLTKVSGESMEDTLFQNEYLVVSDFMYEPEIGDIVVIQNTALQDDLLREPLVKRVIAVGGQSVDISPYGVVTVTDKDGSSRILEQDYIKKQPYTGASGHFEVPEGSVFVMGDNRNHSTDSRSSRVGVIDERCIFGKALIRILPFGEFTVFENPYNN